jgi:hypothetical protein
VLLTATGAGGAFRAAFNTSAASLDICPGALSERTEGKLAAAGRGYIHTIDAFDTLLRKFISRTAGSGVGQRKGWRGNNPRVERRNFSDPSVKLRRLQRRRLHRSDIGRGSALRRGMVSGDDETATSPPPHSNMMDALALWVAETIYKGVFQFLMRTGEWFSYSNLCFWCFQSLVCCVAWSTASVCLSVRVNGAPRAEHLLKFRSLSEPFFQSSKTSLSHITSKLSSHNHDAIPT